MGISTTPATGARGQVRIGAEALYGVHVAPTHIIDFTSESMTATENTIQSEAIRGDRGVHKLIQGSIDIAGDVSYEQSASGYGMILRHALGDYIRAADVDGGYHARMGRDAVVTIPATGGTGVALPIRYFIPFTEDASADFPAAGSIAIVYRDATSNALAFDNAGGAGVLYTDAAIRDVSYIDTTATAEDFGGEIGIDSITVKPITDADGNLVNPEFNPSGGLIQVGSTREELQYVAAADLGPSAGTKLYLDVGALAAADTLPVSDMVVINVPGIVKETTDFAALTGVMAKGTWVYLIDNVNYAGVYTHHLERGRRLPIGMTIEVDRDAAIFKYSGCKVNTLTANFETNAVATATVSFMGRAEHSVVQLMADVVPQAGSILVDNVDAFPDPQALNITSAQFTIGEETGMTYTTIVDNNDGTFTLSGIPQDASDQSIESMHLKGSNVDCRTSSHADIEYEGNNSPLSSFEILAYIDGYFEEVLSGSVTLNNNLNGDKYGLGSKNRLQLVPERANVEANLSMEFDDGKHYKKFLKGELFALEFKCVSEADDAEILETGIPAQAYYFLPKCKFNGNTPTIEGESYITHDMPITAIVDDEFNTTDLVIILVNGEIQDVEAP